jgi:hypothetical protein
MWPTVATKPEAPSTRHLSGIFYACMNLSLAWPASTLRAKGQVDFIRLADLTLIEQAKQEVPHGKSDLGRRRVDHFFFRSRTITAYQQTTISHCR